MSFPWKKMNGPYKCRKTTALQARAVFKCYERFSFLPFFFFFILLLDNSLSFSSAILIKEDNFNRVFYANRESSCVWWHWIILLYANDLVGKWRRSVTHKYLRNNELVSHGESHTRSHMLQFENCSKYYAGKYIFLSIYIPTLIKSRLFYI